MKEYSCNIVTEIYQKARLLLDPCFPYMQRIFQISADYNIL